MPDIEKPKTAAASAAASAAKAGTVDIVLVRDMQVGDRQRTAGEKLATIALEADVSHLFLARAICDDLAAVS